MENTFRSIEIIKEATFVIKQVNGTDCYKKDGKRFYRCFINQNEGLNKGVKWHRISKEEYDCMELNYLYLHCDTL